MSHQFAGVEPTPPPYAGWWQRFAALTIDGLLLALPFVVSLVVVLVVTEGGTGEDDDDSIWYLLFVGWAAWIVVPFFYYTILHGRPRGQTIGKRLLGIQVTGEDLRPIGYGRAFGRFLVGWVMWLACYLPGILDNLWPLWDDRKQALHDKVANSIVVRV